MSDDNPLLIAVTKTITYIISNKTIQDDTFEVSNGCNDIDDVDFPI